MKSPAIIWKHSSAPTLWRKKPNIGTSENFPDIRWQTTIESFYEPLTSKAWVRGVCSAEYTDSAGTTQNVELTNWLTNLSDAQMKQLMERSELQKKMLAKHILETEELAAEFAGVDTKTIQQWVKNGMPMTAEHEYLKPWLDLYLQTNGNPTEQDMQDILTEFPELSSTRPVKATQDQSATTGTQHSPRRRMLPDSEMTTSEEIDPETAKRN